MVLTNAGRLSAAIAAMTQFVDQARRAGDQHPEATFRFFLAQFRAAASGLPSARREAVRALDLANAGHDEEPTQV